MKLAIIAMLLLLPSGCVTLYHPTTIKAAGAAATTILTEAAASTFIP